MGSRSKRLELLIDVFEKTNQRALATPDLTPPQLVGAILQEFRELEYLSDSPEHYRLLRADDRSPLDNEREISQQLSDNSVLVLEEEALDLPAGAQLPSSPIYFREQVSGKVFKCHWLPAIIGRPDRNQPHNELVAVNLGSYQTSLRVSRRHAQITEKDGAYFIESLSRNPTYIKREDAELMPVTAEKQPIYNGDLIVLERSNIALKFIARRGMRGKD